MTTRRTAARLLAVPGGALLLALVAAGPAAAHVTITPSEGAAGARSVLTASVSHGCDGSPTTRLAIQIPEEILSVAPTRNPGWEVEKEMVDLAEPVSEHGTEVTERVGSIVYTAEQPLPDGVRDTFELSLTLPQAAGETLAFPVIQTCAQGETAWVEVAAEGQDPEELESPAPTVTILPAADADVPAAAGDGTPTLAVLAPAVGVLGLLAGGAALLLARRRA